VQLKEGESPMSESPKNYERYFVPAIGAPLATDLIDIAALRPGVLDVACGTGVVARLAAERVGATGTVAGIVLLPQKSSLKSSRCGVRRVFIVAPAVMDMEQADLTQPAALAEAAVP
jgi:SAM-dependent methyltransferase